MFNFDLLAYLESYLTEERKVRFLEILSNRTNYLTVAIEDVYQLHNTSAVIRSCDAFGVQTVHVVEDRFGKRLDKNIAMGAQQWVDVERYANTKDCITQLKQKGYQIWATTPHGNCVDLPDFNFTQKTALFFGTERTGLSQEVLDQADGFLKVPMVGFSESLNVSVCAAILVQVLADKLRRSDMPWQLSAQELLDKRLDWSKKSIKSVDLIIDRYLKDK
ncbi:TrmH family RNA methyltransferase [Croceivirga radicis]|uniref:tRNA (guanosine(18)-2'-O)-methyltransferase n=1 Tax=Croceivirga radicis TaxID=1929488 RepID=A0A1V6LTD6_9FLAO|nr:RNA methyltransferase [Croceivirga radicis]OQD43445.1 rRNA methyltransferase [Croceivirga radicis]